MKPNSQTSILMIMLQKVRDFRIYYIIIAYDLLSKVGMPYGSPVKNKMSISEYRNFCEKGMFTQLLENKQPSEPLDLMAKTQKGQIRHISSGIKKDLLEVNQAKSRFRHTKSPILKRDGIQSVIHLHITSYT